VEFNNNDLVTATSGRDEAQLISRHKVAARYFQDEVEQLIADAAVAGGGAR